MDKEAMLRSELKPSFTKRSSALGFNICVYILYTNYNCV